MTGRPNFVSRPNENDSITTDPAGKRSFAAEESAKKRDNDHRSKDSYEPSNKRGSGVEREFPTNDSGPADNENIESDEDNRGAA
jgi:hypothetical protein